MRWDVFCRVIDNFGDVGVAWRLARDLASRGEAVRLWIDDPAPLAFMAPRGAAGVEVVRWTDPAPDLEPGDAVAETFGCDPPPAFVARMAARTRPPPWLNLEYLTAEPYAERCHGLPSPQSAGPGRGLTKWFYYPGFDAATGGLLREPGLAAARAAFDRDAWLEAQGFARRPGERVAVLFCYDNPALPGLLATLGARPTLLLATAGAAQRHVAALMPPPALRTVALPWLDHDGFDRLLWSADLNFVRGEDSFVRAQWAGAPFVWQIYPQADGAHAAKLDAFLDRFAAIAGDDGAMAALRALWRGWNGLGPWPRSLPDETAWRAACDRWRETLLAQDDLVTRLLGFVRSKC